MSAPRQGPAPGGGQCQERVWAAWSARLGAEEQIWTCCWDLKALLCASVGLAAPEPLGPTALPCPGAWGRGCPLPRAAWGAAGTPSWGVTARPSAEPLSRGLEHKGDRGQRSFSRGGGGGAGSSLLPSGRDWAAAGSKQAAAGRPVPGSAGVAGGALLAAAKPWTAPDPASAGSAQTRFLASPPPTPAPSRAANIPGGTAGQRQHRQLGWVSSARTGSRTHGEDRPCGGVQIRVKPNPAPQSGPETMGAQAKKGSQRLGKNSVRRR